MRALSLAAVTATWDFAVRHSLCLAAVPARWALWGDRKRRFAGPSNVPRQPDASPPRFALASRRFSSASAQFYVLKDNVALRGSDITNPQESTDPNTRQPAITFGFNSNGKTEFQNLTAAIARRGGLVSGLGQSLNQHFAVALDNQLITVPYIDYKQFPHGINGDNGADISSSFTKASAQDLANELRLGAVPLNLRLICQGSPATTPCHARMR
jgi:preprotein translocase subunit SecD